jgi:hypothetical protein
MVARVIQYADNASGSDEWGFNDLGGGYYALINRRSTRSMVVQSASSAENAAVVQYTFGGSNTDDEWQAIDHSGGHYRIINRNSGKALTVGCQAPPTAPRSSKRPGRERRISNSG